MTTVLTLDGRTPRIDPDAWLAPNATVIGDATIAAEVSVFYGAVVRADTEAITVGRRTNLQDNVVVHADPGHPATIGDDVTVGHGAVLHGCTIEDAVLIGMGAIVMNGAVVGRGSLVAAGALVLGDQVIPPRSLVAGSPAKVRRDLSDAEVDAHVDSAVRYAAIAALHRAANG